MRQPLILSRRIAPRRIRIPIRTSLLLAGTLALGACGGSGGPGPARLSDQTPAPPPSAPAPPPTVNYETAEYRRSNAAVAANALPAWQLGVGGAGVVVGIIDSGLSNGNGEFTGRISTHSRDVTGAGRAIDDPAGHGTAVAAVLAAGRNDSNIVGIAPEANLLVLRADNGDCSDGCHFSDSAIAAGIDAAIAARARVINISLGGSTTSPVLHAAFQRATAADRVIVISAGNDGNAEIDSLAAAALNAGGSAHVIIAGASDASGAISSFSNRAGSAQANFILALGERVRSFDATGTALLYSGTSMAVPAVSGALALLAQNFPSLSGSDLVDILLRAADDAGATGTDAIYGRGLLNIGTAMAPAGATSLSGTSIIVPATASGSLGSAFGDGLAQSQGLTSAKVTDSYGRVYAAPLAASLRRAPVGRLRGRLQSASLLSASTTTQINGLDVNFQVRAIAQNPNSLAADFRAPDRETAHLGFAQRGMDAHAGLRNPWRETRLSLSAADGFGFVLASGQLAAESLPGAVPQGFVTDDGLSPDDGTGSSGRLLLMAQKHSGPFTWALAASRRSFDLLPLPALSRSARQDRLTVATSYAHGPWSFALHAQHSEDFGALLGTRLAPGFGLAGGRTLALGGAAAWQHAGMLLRLAGTLGWVEPHFTRGALLQADGRLKTAGWSLSGAAPIGPGQLRLQIAGPMVVTGGQFRLANGVALPAAALARETAAELGYALGPVSLALFARRNTGNISGLDDAGSAFSFRTAF